MAEIKRYVCTASTAGGNGTTTATTGDNRAYATLEECMNANEQDLTDGGGDTFVVEITGDCSTADGSLVYIHNYTTSATCTITISTVGTARHNGKAASVSGRNNHTLNPSTFGNVLTIDVNYVTIDGLEILDWYSQWGNGSVYAICVNDTKTYTTLKNNLIHDGKSGHTYLTGIISFGNYQTFYNNIVYNCVIQGIWSYGYRTMGFYNNTVYGCGTGMVCDSAVTVKNNLVYNNTTDFNGTGAANSDYNFSKDDSAPDSGGHSIWGTTDGKTPDFVSTSAGSEDFHLQSTSDAIDAGTDLNATIGYPDIDGVNRSGTWDIGADEYVAAASTTVPLRTLMGVGV